MFQGGFPEGLDNVGVSLYGPHVSTSGESLHNQIAGMQRVGPSFDDPDMGAFDEKHSQQEELAPGDVRLVRRVKFR